MKPTIRPGIRKIREQTLADYLPLAEAAAIMDMSRGRILTWCRQRNIRHIKVANRWHLHRLDLLAALRQDADKDTSA